MVEILLHEDRLEEAWREAHGNGCHSDLWLRLAERREKEHPAEAARVYLLQADRAIQTATNSRYEAGVQLLERAAALLHALGQGPQFLQQLETLLQKYQRKPSLLRLVTQRRKFLYLPQ